MIPLTPRCPQKKGNAAEKGRKKSYAHKTAEVNLAEHGLGSFVPLAVSSQIVIYPSDWKGRERCYCALQHCTPKGEKKTRGKKREYNLDRKIDRTGLS